ncbi:Nnf1-domain-containing protein [Lipomyces arxii]|uniref:Nnf1-domain-containing protein n=1 Tax=Lipomyces arxii TaxID=56418 RepID=UPI0034CE1293
MMADTQATDKVSIRNQRLIEVFQRSLQASTKTLTFDKLAQCYPYVAEHGAAGLREAMDQAMKFWESASNREFEAILKERDVESKLTELDQLIEEARDRKTRSEKGILEGVEQPIHVESLSPDDIVKAHLVSINLAEADKFEKRIQESQSVNKKLLRQVAEQEDEIDSLLSGIQKSLADLSAASKESIIVDEQKDAFRTVIKAVNR